MILTRSLLVLALASALALLWGGAASPGLASLTSLWAEAGCTADPDGCTPARSHGDNGCTADPSGTPCTKRS